MKKPIKIFISIVYYLFMVVVVLLLAVILPQDNKYNLLNNCIKDSINSSNYVQIPALFSPYYNETPVVNINEGNQIIQIYEATTTDEVYDTNNYYAKSTYMGFIFNCNDYDYEDLTDSNDNTYNYTKLVIGNDNNTYDVLLDSANFTYLDSYNMVQFEIDEFDFIKSNLSTISSIIFYQNNNSKYLTINNLNLNFNSSFFNYIETYNYLYNEQLYDIPLTLGGTFTKTDSSTTLSTGASISFQSTVQVLIEIASNNLLQVSADDSILNANFGTTTYTVSAGSNVLITSLSETSLDYISFTYDGSLSYAYSFNDTIDTTKYKKVFSFNGDESIIGKTYNEDEVETSYNNWLESYTYSVSNYNDVISGATSKAIWQVILVIILFLIIGDTLIGNRIIIKFIKWIISKFKKNNPNDNTSEVTPKFNDYEVNVECKIIVPDNYDKNIHIVYKLKDEDTTMTFDLDKKHNYIMTNRYRNGIYELIEINIPELELVDTKKILSIKGYKYKLELTAINKENNN